MTIKSFAYDNLKKLCLSLGKHNDALYAVLAIAMFKGIMRPTFTMMDKESDKDTKKYAAFREGLTEAIAFCSYIATHKLILPQGVRLAKYVNKNRPKELPNVSVRKVQNGLSLLSVCLTAGIIIPAVCNVVLKPVMDGVAKVMNKNKKDKTQKLDIKENVVQNVTVPTVYSPKLSENSKKLLAMVKTPVVVNSSMKVGG